MEALVSAVMEQLTSNMRLAKEQSVRIVVGSDMELEKLYDMLQTIEVVLSDAEPRRFKEARIELWLDQLQDTCYDLDDVLDEWSTALLKLRIEGVENARVLQRKVRCFLPSVCFRFRQFVLGRNIAAKLKEISKRLDRICLEKYSFNFYLGSSIRNSYDMPTSFLVDSVIISRDYEKKILISMLLSNVSEKLAALHVFSIVGMGGIGKTTLARIVYNSEEVMHNFDNRIWVCVSDPFDEFRIAKAIAESLGVYNPNSVELESLLQSIYKSIMGKKFLLVLDDIWTGDYTKWEPFYLCLKNGARGSKILITTRNLDAAHMMQSIKKLYLSAFDVETSWSLFKKLAFSGMCPEDREYLEDIGREIIQKCKGLPLALNTIGALLRFKTTREDWQKILTSEFWDRNEVFGSALSPLLLSYNDLPPMIRRCFCYCAIFPKDYRIDKGQLIKLWMAQGYLGFQEDAKMEIIGENYFNILAARFFFHEFERDHDGNILFCMMHDLVHDLALFCGRNECFSIDVNYLEDQSVMYSTEKICHLTIMLGTNASFPTSIFSFTRLHSLLIEYKVTNCSTISNILPLLLDKLIFLRALDLSANQWYENLIIEIPKEIGRLIFLRYLDLSLLKIKELPETLCELYNLQTLVLSWCTNLKNLPQGMGKLINLRHLVNNGTSLSYMPDRIGRLTRLLTLSEFVVSAGGKAGTLESLKNLNQLCGSLCIKMLGNVTDVTRAEKAELWNKKNLLFLYLNFEKDSKEERVSDNEERWGMDKDEGVLKALQPPPSLKTLEIRYYRGNTVPLNWIMSLTNLRMLSLHDCMNIEHLPPLGKLSSLESLSIWSMKSVKRVGNEFLRIEKDDASSSSTVSAFPKLVSLKFVNMEEWEKWDCGTIMPRLCSLALVYCPKLKALPDYVLQSGGLKELDINWCPFLKERYDKWTGEDWHKINQIPNIMINFETVQ